MTSPDWGKVWRKLSRGLAEQVRGNGFSDVVLGLSGGMDSSLVAALAVEALGRDHVHGVLLPSPWTSRASIDDAVALAENLGMEYRSLPIEPLMRAYEQALAPSFVGREPDVTEENLQARIRGTLLMALSNKFGWMLLATGNKSELGTGYCTLYGDLCGGLAPIGGLYKTQVYEVAAWYNAQAGRLIIPQNVFDKAPSAELRPGQTDQDSLPPYSELDAILQALVDQGMEAETLRLPGIAPELVRRVEGLVRRSAFKRRQAPPVLPLD